MASAAARTGLVTMIALCAGAFASAAPLERPAPVALQSSSSGMSNQDVIMMVGAGLAEDVIITAIKQAPRRNFDLNPSGLIELKLAKVPDAIVRAMQSLEPGSAPATRPSSSASAPASPPPSSAPITSASPTPSSARSSSSAPSPTRSAAPALASLPEPTTAGELYGVVAATGTLRSLERVQMRDKKVGNPRSSGMFKSSVQDFAYYFEGATSPVTFVAGEPLVFVIRMMGPVDRTGRDATPEEVQKHFLLTKLESEGGRRYITKVDVQFDVKAYGKLTPGLDPRRPTREAASFQLTPRTPLAPGQYVVLMAGTRNYQFLVNVNEGSDRWAFAIVEP